MKPSTFFGRHPVFRLDEFRTAYLAKGTRSAQTAASILKHHVAAGRLINVRRGLYACVPPGADPTSFRVDPFLLASRVSKDSVLAYHSALELLGKAHSLSSRITYLTKRRVKPFEFQGIQFLAVLVPAALRDSSDSGGGLIDEHRHGLAMSVTGYERTMVDVLHSPRYGGGWEEIWRSLEAIEFVDLDFVVDYVLRLGSALTVARVGFFLEQHRDELLVEDRHLKILHANVPARPSYFDRQRRKGGKLLSRWNLIIPNKVLTRAWAEVS